MHDDLLGAYFGQGLQRKIADRILSQPDVAAAVKAKQSAGGALVQILTVIGQYALTFLSTGSIDWSGLIAAIEAIIVPPAQVSGGE